ncbi:hypothetical protein DYU05_03705 [Mucilaginibacter terrenus]|uniref:DUF4488 domain-containing protein n=1 Tax=Mucilaginibacter terrenus TaxID=2482727 RepID=A0A3E2NUP3_9SPHI|nr:hypothetical protein [Mucilaginibacter terrenus]RFZ84723.1 hypothetical protein DYU05_03705 [Mucilaginibacter terrenus]
MIKRLSLVFVIFFSLSFTTIKSFKGTYEYAGGIYNGKPEKASTEYKLLRVYGKADYQGTFIAPGEDTIIYEKGDYKLLPDTCLETQTFSSQPSKWLNTTLRYQYKISHDTLAFSGKLPNGTTVLEYWKKVK